MPAQLGRALLLEVDSNGSATYQSLGGIRSRDFSINNEPVDVTHSLSTNQYRVLLANAGVKSLDVSGDGVLDDDAAINTIEGYARAGTIRNWRITVPGFATYVGNFMVTAFNVSGAYNDAVMFSITLQSSGDVTFTTIT
jgi:TP901-1 family phage major tail protein